MSDQDLPMLDLQAELLQDFVLPKRYPLQCSIELDFVDILGRRLENIPTLNSSVAVVKSQVHAVDFIKPNRTIIEALEHWHGVIFPMDLIFVDVKVWNGDDYSMKRCRWTHDPDTRISLDIWHNMRALLLFDADRDTLDWPCPKIELVVGKRKGMGIKEGQQII